MKNLFLLLFALAFAVSSCNKKEEEVMTEEEAVDLVEATFAASEEGMAAEITYMANKAVAEQNSYQNNCNYGGDSTFVSSFQGTSRNYSFTFQYTWAAICANGTNIPTALQFNSSRNGNYEGVHLDYNGTGTSEYVLSDLFSGSEYTLNGSSDIAGSSSRVRVRDDQNVTAQYDIEVSLNDIKVDKSSLEINSGSASLTLAASNDEQSVTFTASITFLGNRDATVVINGNTYTISL